MSVILCTRDLINHSYFRPCSRGVHTQEVEMCVHSIMQKLVMFIALVVQYGEIFQQ
jgi:hypothetical protein